MNPPGKQDDEAARIAALHSLDVLDTPAEAAFDALVASASLVTGCPVALISLADENRLWFKARIGLDVESTARHPSFCDHAIRGEGLFEVPDLQSDPRFADNPLVTDAPHLRFYAGEPLHVDRQRVGTLCVLDRQPRKLDEAQRLLLAKMAAAVAELLVSRRRLRESEEDRQRLFDFGRAGGDWMWESDAEHRYVWISDNFESRTGLHVADYIGQPIADFVVLGPEGQPTQPPLRFREVLDRRAPFSRVIAPKPTPRGTLLLSRSAVPVFDASGRFAGYRGTIRDISSQLRAGARLRERDERLGKLAQQVPGVVFQYQWHPDGRSSYPYISERAREVFGSDPSIGGSGAKPAVPLRLLHPDDRADFERSLSDSARTLKPWLREFRIVREDGSVRWLDTLATPERLPDGSILWHGFTADITARKEIEARLHRKELQWQLAAQAARIGLAQLSLSDGIVHLDPQARANLGLESTHDGLTLAAWFESIDPTDRVAADDGVQRLLKDGTPFEGRYRVRLPDGRLRWIEFVVRASHDAQGRIDGLIGTCRDVHEQQTAAQIERARQDIERASRAKSEFLSRLSHELRTPLNGILGFAQLMAIDSEQPLSGRQAQRLASIQQAGTHLLGLINDVLEISRSDTTGSDWQVRSVDIEALVDSTIGLVRPLAQPRLIKLERESGGSSAGGVAVLGEPRRIEQVLMNLLSNAIKYSPVRGKVTVRILRAAQVVRIAISDEGRGIGAAQFARLFQPFERLDAEKQPGDGFGLGLFIARQLAEAMGGSIEVASRVGAGSTFTLTLQRALEAPPAPGKPGKPAAPQAPESVSAAPAQPVRPKRILYVEDESLNQLLFQEVMRGRPHWQLHLADNGAAGLQLAHELQPDLMLIDINLPDTNGLALVARLRADERTRALRCVALSADAMTEQIESARRVGFDDYWTKPIDVAQVLGKIDELLKDKA